MITCRCHRTSTFSNTPLTTFVSSCLDMPCTNSASASSSAASTICSALWAATIASMICTDDRNELRVLYHSVCVDIRFCQKSLDVIEREVELGLEISHELFEFAWFESSRLVGVVLAEQILDGGLDLREGHVVRTMLPLVFVCSCLGARCSCRSLRVGETRVVFALLNRRVTELLREVPLAESRQVTRL